MVNINENYFDPELRRPVSIEQVNRRNKYYASFIKKMQSDGINVKFITPSIYEQILIDEQ